MQVTTMQSDQLMTTEGVSRALCALLVTASVVLLIGQYTDIDLLLADFYFDAGLHDFPWRRSWFATDFMHGSVKNVLNWIGYLILAVALLDLAYPIGRLTPLARMQLRIVALALLIAPLIVNTLKQASSLHCPWSIDRYGGSEPLLRVLDWVPPGWHAGHCFPAGHASTGMWLAALAVFWLPHNPRRAFAVFLGGSGVGLVLGWVQQMRGAHFLTHTLATAWITSAVLLALIVVVPRLRLLAHGSLLHALCPASCGVAWAARKGR